MINLCKTSQVKARREQGPASSYSVATIQPVCSSTTWPFAAQIKSKTEKKKDKFFTMDPTQISFDMVRQKLKDIVMTRGKRGVDRNEQVEMLSYLATVAKGPVQKIEVLIQVVSALFDINPSMSSHMSVPLWKRCAGTLLDVLQTLADNQHIEVDENYDSPEERTEEPPAGQPAKVGTSVKLSFTDSPVLFSNR